MKNEEIEKKLDICHSTQEYKDFIKDWKGHPFRTYLMEWDFEVCVEYWDSEENCGMIVDDGDEVFLHPENESEESVVVPSLDAWKGKPIGPFCKVPEGEKPDFDWDAWNKEGIELAQKLRELLPDEYTLYYSRPFEDYENLDKPPILIPKVKTEL